MARNMSLTQTLSKSRHQRCYRLKQRNNKLIAPTLLSCSIKTFREEDFTNIQQNFKVDRVIGTSIFSVRMDLGNFEDDAYVIWVHFTGEDVDKVYIIPFFVDNGTKLRRA